jgi:hypothetical protein
MARPRITTSQGMLFLRQLEAALDFVEAAGGGGGGGPVAWADVTGKPTFGTASAENIAFFAAAAHTHSIANVTGLQTALDGKQAAGSYAAASHTHTAAAVTDFAAAVGLLVQPKTATLSIPTLSRTHRQTVTDGAVSPTSRIMVSLGAMGPTDENEADQLSAVTLSAVPGTGTFVVTAQFAMPERGSIPIFYTVG